MQVEDGKGGANGRGKADTGSREDLLGLPIREESADERLRPAGRGDVQVYGQSTPWIYGGGEAGAMRDRSGINR